MLKFLEKLRAFFFIIVVLAAMALCAVDLMKIQIVDGESYLNKAKSTSIAKQDISGADCVFDPSIISK